MPIKSKHEMTVHFRVSGIVSGSEECNVYLKYRIPGIQYKMTNCTDVSSFYDQVSFLGLKGAMMYIKDRVSNIKDRVPNAGVTFSSSGRFAVGRVRRLISISSIKCQISNVKYPISYIKCQISSIKYQVSYTKYQMSNIKCQIPGITYQMPNIKYQISNIK